MSILPELFINNINVLIYQPNVIQSIFVHLNDEIIFLKNSICFTFDVFVIQIKLGGGIGSD